jgi:hypothetical protein
MTTPPLEDAATDSERRQCVRRRFHGSMEIEWGSAVLTGTVRDIGPRGLFVELSPPLWFGATFHARLNLNPVLLLDCTVVRVEPGKGIAVVFEVPEDNGKAQMEGLLVSLPAV